MAAEGWLNEKPLPPALARSIMTTLLRIMQGTIFTMGGLMIVLPGAQGIVYRYAEKYMGDLPPDAKVTAIAAFCTAAWRCVRLVHSTCFHS